MISIKVPLTDEKHRLLKELKKKTGKSMALLVREACDDFLYKQEKPAERNYKKD